MIYGSNIPADNGCHGLQNSCSASVPKCLYSTEAAIHCVWEARAQSLMNQLLRSGNGIYFLILLLLLVLKDLGTNALPGPAHVY